MTVQMTHDNLAEALYELQQEVGQLPRDANNPFFHSTFSSFPAIKALVDPIAWKHGLFVKQALSSSAEHDLLINTLYFNGEVADETVIRMHLPTPTPQNHGSATTYYRRYAYTTCLGLVSEVDDDGNAASAPQKPAQAPQRRPSPLRTVAPVDDLDEEF